MNEVQATVKRLVNRADALRSFCCMTEAPNPWPEALHVCRNWIAQNLGVHVEGLHLESPGGEVIGHLYYALYLQALFAYQVDPANVGVLYCEWVQRRRQEGGLGKQLFEAFLDEMREQEVGGVLVEATGLEGQMYYEDYLGRGFSLVHQAGDKRLLYYPLSQPAIQVRPTRPSLQPRTGTPVEVVILAGFLCPYDVSTHLALRQVAREFGKQVVLREELLSPESMQKYGVSRGIFINGRQKLFGGEAEQAIRLAILEEM